MIEEFKPFIAVVDFKTFTKAAEYLNLSQPSVSTHIKNLEIIFGVTLINRSVKQKTISITESGYTLYKRAKEIINLLDVTFMDVKTLYVFDDINSIDNWYVHVNDMGDQDWDEIEPPIITKDTIWI